MTSDLSFRQLMRVVLTGASLAFVAGYTNAVCVYAAFTTATSHMTGVIARLASASVPDARPPGETLLGIPEAVVLLGFLCGAVSAGTVIGPSVYFRMRFTTRHGAALLLESAALLLALLLLGGNLVVGRFFAGFAMGLQNGVTTIYSGALLRTTHMTGVVTDIGVLLGERIHEAIHALVGRTEERPLVHTEMWRLKVLVPLLGAFYLGAVAGVQAFFTGGIVALAFPAAAAATGGIAAILYDRYKLRLQPPRTPGSFSRMYEKTIGLLALQRGPLGGATFGKPVEMCAPEHFDARFVAVNTDTHAAAPAADVMAAHAALAMPSSAILAAPSSGTATMASLDVPPLPPMSPTAAALAVQGDWDQLPYAMFLRHKQRQGVHALEAALSSESLPPAPAPSWMPSLNYGDGFRRLSVASSAVGEAAIKAAAGAAAVQLDALPRTPTQRARLSSGDGQ